MLSSGEGLSYRLVKGGKKLDGLAKGVIGTICRDPGVIIGIYE